MWLSRVSPGLPPRRQDLLPGLGIDVDDPPDGPTGPPTLEDIQRRTVFHIMPRGDVVPPADFALKMKQDPEAHRVVPFWCAVLRYRNETVLQNVLNTVLESEEAAMAKADAVYPPLFATAAIIQGKADVPGRPPGTRGVNINHMVFMLLMMMGNSPAVATAVQDVNLVAKRGDVANDIMGPWHVTDGEESRICQFMLRMSPDAVDKTTGRLKPATRGSAWEDVNKERPDPATVHYPIFDASPERYAIHAALDFVRRFGSGEPSGGAGAVV